MVLTRGRILTIGPVVLVAVCYAIAAPSRASSTGQMNAIVREEPPTDVADEQPLSVRCEEAARGLRKQIDFNWNIIVRVPFVLAGDLSERELTDDYELTIVPTANALANCYFNNPPRHPTIILLCSTDARFRECNLLLDEADRSQFSGIYSRKHRRVIVNIESGEGTIAHEMTHALAHADFPTMPEWFDEGLASLHEECHFSPDGHRLIGDENWRNEAAHDALNRGELRLLEDVASKRFGSRDRANGDYAFVRTFCVYLQQRGLLERYYRVCRSNIAADPTGLRSLCEVADAPNPQSIDDAFRVWLLSQTTNVSK